MTRKVATSKTAEQRHEEMDLLHKSIATQVELLRNSDQWLKFCNFARQFHQYSLSNLMLIQAQCPDAGQVAGYSKWKKLGRQVRKGERGLRILGGRHVKFTVEDKKTGEEKEKQALRFFPVSVFDKSQTDPIDPEAEDNSTIAHQLNGADPQGIFGAVADYLESQGWSVERIEITGGTNGYTDMKDRRIVIDSRLEPAQAAKTILHEAAHANLHSDDAPQDYVEHRGVKETEAESVAYIVAGMLGLDTSSYSIGYVAGWSLFDTKLIKQTADNVLRAAHAISDAITYETQAAVTLAA